MKALFASALERAPDERERFLAEACEDASIRNEVTSLLQAHEETDGFIERPALEQAGLALARAPEAWLGRRLGA
ncbi:MAG: hypothetical protein ACREUC_20595, partial [Steroidobacteraceae bacterium]